MMARREPVLGDGNAFEEVVRLQQQLDRLVRGAGKDRLHVRYPLVWKAKEELSLYRRARVWLGRGLQRLGLKEPHYPEPWLAGLRHVEHAEVPEALVIWGLGVERNTLRAACRGFESVHAALPGYVPVLVTDVADFAFFSRLGWLVEYVPTLSPPAIGYAERKMCYLAWRYRDAPALPVSLGLMKDLRIAEFVTRVRELKEGRS